ncbi:hypothetical protein BH11PAT1_BH11PAT1_5480 [soil metagenome]
MDSAIFKNKLTYLLLGYYILLVIWWMKIFFTGEKETGENFFYGFAYAIIALIGGVNGLWISRRWGGFKSQIGKGISFLSLGLLGICFGQFVWSYYNFVLHVEVPYPSLADVGYFSIIPFYSLGMYYFAMASGAKSSLQKLQGKLITLLIPLVLLIITYLILLKNVTPDFSNPIKLFLDYGSPFGEAIAISIGILAFLLSRNTLGGSMRSRILFVIFALIFEFATGMTFLFQAGTGQYYNAGPVDLMWTTSFTIMSLGLIAFRNYD